MSELCVIVMAAGQGKRMKSDLPKVLHEALGRPMIHTILDTVAALAPRAVVVVTGHGSDLVRASVAASHPGARFAHQREQLGTGHAVRCALPEVPPEADEVMILSGDTPLLTPELLNGLLARHRASGAAATVCSMTLADPTGYGRIVRADDGAHLARIVEHRDADAAVRAIREVNAGLYVFARTALASSLARLTADNDQGEYYLTDTVALLVADGMRVAVAPAADPALCLGVNSRAELLEAAAHMRRAILRRLMADGVTVRCLETVEVEPGCAVGADTVLEPGARLRAGSAVGRGCTIGPDTLLVDAQVGDGARVRMSLLEGCDIPAGADIGPYTRTAGPRARG